MPLATDVNGIMGYDETSNTHQFLEDIFEATRTIKIQEFHLRVKIQEYVPFG